MGTLVKSIRNLLFLTSIILFTYGCSGGGSTGTGGGPGLVLSGTLVSKIGTPLSGVIITGVAAQTKDMALSIDKSLPANTDLTDNRGRFTIIVAREPDQDVEISCDGPGIHSQLLVTQIPSAASVASIKLRFDDDTGEIGEDEVNYENENGETIDDGDSQ